MIGDELYEMLSKRPLGVQAKGQISRKYPAFIQTLQADLRRQLGKTKPLHYLVREFSPPWI